MAKNLSSKECQQIRNLYLSGLSYRDINEQTGYTNSTISKNVKGLRTHRESIKLARKQGKGKLTDDGRRRLSNAGKKACISSRKFWTKPEQMFMNLLRQMGFGIKIPSYIVEMVNTNSDEDGEILYQFPLQRYVCDFVWPDKKIIFNVNGDFWHANPILYSPDKFTDIQINTVRKDKNRKIFLNKRKWKQIDIWESELLWNIGQVIRKVNTANKSLLSKSERIEDSIDNDWSERLKLLWFKKPRVYKRERKQCPFCKKEFMVIPSKANKRKYCSKNCVHISRRKTERPNIVILEQLLSENSFVQVGKMFGVSDNAIRKWLKTKKGP